MNRLTGRQTVKLEIPLDALAEALRMSGMHDRLTEMVEQYGEVCSRAKAERILHCGDEKLDEHIAMGRIRTACEGVFIDVRSIAQFIERRPVRGRNGAKKAGV